MAQISTADFRNGMTVIFEDKLMELVEFQHVKPGKGGAFVRTKLKNIMTGRVLERTFRSGEKMEEVRLIEERYHYSYDDGDLFYFMHKQTYEMLPVSKDAVGESKDYMKENDEVGLLFHDGRVLSVHLPSNVVLEISQTEPGLQGDRAQGGTKPAFLETGAQIQVPLFVNQGDLVRVDTRTGAYIERA